MLHWKTYSCEEGEGVQVEANGGLSRRGRLTGQLSPGRHAADGVDRISPQTVVEQLPIPDPRAQQDSIDLLLGWGLQGNKTDGGV